MTTDDKVDFINSCIRMIRDADNLNIQAGHRSFARGIIAAWSLDNSISLQQQIHFNNEVDV